MAPLAPLHFAGCPAGGFTPAVWRAPVVGVNLWLQMLGSDPHEHLAEVLTAHQPAERGRRARKPVGDVFLVTEQSRADPTADHSLELRKSVQVILDHDAA